ncbi:MAG: hypothetical protein INF43_00555 [Alphaproteobacteria bacterium]|jgi:hypothetical protein|nr:hypothetical protein [Alphaproteobacteria bacterium]
MTATAKKSPQTTQHTQKLRRAARAIDALCGVPGQPDVRALPTAKAFKAALLPALKAHGFAPVVRFQPALVAERPGIVARYQCSDDGETLRVDLLHDGREGWVLRSWNQQESRGLDLRDFLPTAA